MGNRADLYNRTKQTACLNAIVKTADTNCAVVDLKGFEEAHFLVSVGVGGITFDGSNYIAIEMEHSDDNSSFSDVTDSAHVTGNVEDLTGGLCQKIDAADEDDVTIPLQYKGPKRYVRIVLNFVGTHGTGTPVCVVGLAAGSAHLPI